MDKTDIPREQLHALVHPWPGHLQMEERLLPPAASAVDGEPDGGPVSCGYLGDIRLRFVLLEPGSETLHPVLPGDMQRLELTPERALALSIFNLRRAFPAPRANALDGGIYSLRADLHALSSTYLLDRSFWRGQLAQFPQGLLAALPQRGVLLFAPAGNEVAEAALLRQAGKALASAGAGRLSTCLYLFDATGWRVRQQLPEATPASRNKAAPARAAQRHDDEEPDLDSVGSGQKTLVRCVLLGLVIGGIARSSALPPAAEMALQMIITVYALAGVARLGTGLRQSKGSTIAFMAASLVPLLGLLGWIILSLRATRTLRAHGWHVGLFGVRGD